MKLGLVVTATLLALVSTLTPVKAQGCGPRVRKDWDAMTTTEKDTYRGALAAAMDSGAYIKFIEMHTEMQSELMAHRQCMFIYWHRMLLVAFENMLRGQGARFACVTVPYYNWVGAHDRVLAGTCSSIGDCSSIMSELGGYTSGTRQTVNINGVNNSGRCASEYPLNHFCQSRRSSGSACAQCVPRGNWDTRSVPASTSFASVRQQIFNAQNIGQMSPNVERGCHNGVHSSLSGTMQTFAAPSDPIFWSHHAMVDALHTIFHKCRVGSERLTFAQKAAHPVAWTSCARRDEGTFNPTDLIVMRTGANGNRPIQGSEDPLVGRYFTGVPNQFAGLMDVRDLGDSSYSYELSGQLADMYNNCDGTSTTAPTPAAPATRPVTPTAPRSAPATAPRSAPATAPRSAPATAPRSAPATTPRSATPTAPRPINAAPRPINPAPRPINPAPRPINAPRPGANQPLPPVRSNRRRLKALPKDEPTIETYCDDDETARKKRLASAPPNDNVDVVIVEKKGPEEELVDSWYDKTLNTMGGQTPEIMADLERQVCMFEEVCMGGTPSYSTEFQETWGVKEPRCLTIINAIKSGKEAITYGDWQRDMESYFGCPKPANETQSDHPICT